MHLTHQEIFLIQKIKKLNIEQQNKLSIYILNLSIKHTPKKEQKNVK